MLATNIAESSITIDDVVHVLDCGKAKETSYDALNKLACLLPSWISKASAHQVSTIPPECKSVSGKLLFFLPFHFFPSSYVGRNNLKFTEERPCWACAAWNLLQAISEGNP